MNTIDDVIEEVLARSTAKPPTPPPRTSGRRRHSGRAAAKAKRFVCMKTIECLMCGKSLAEDNKPCHVAVVFYPPGVPKIGCGRIFTTSQGLHYLHPKMFDNPVRYPYGCLSDILAADEREVK
jgi:hypothetical protein